MGERGEALRAEILSIFGMQSEPISAYGLLDELKKTNAKIAPPTVYRALSALVNGGRIHRLESLNAYVVCQHDDHQNAPILSICDDCGTVEETIALDLVADISSNIGQTGFVAERHMIEVHGTCGSCTSEKAPK
ncbi:zinc uptake regulation protein [Rhodobacterales bacterium HTCC2150]|nr:zinc uptake regulation protein [Rhodobacterales bacterium HTCC2150] [Rhodobacteraceae bacterium HTCC2150]